MKIPLSKPFFSGKESHYVADLMARGQIDSDGLFTRACAETLEERFSIKKILITPSCTASLEMALMLCGLNVGDEVILPSFTFASTANAILRVGAKPVFVEIRPDTLNLDVNLVPDLITSRTKAIIPVHYAGVACDMDQLETIARTHQLMVIEDAAQAVNSFYKKRALGTIGAFGAYSFHSTKNYTCGEGGALCINSPEMFERAEIIRDKGTNRGKFLRGEVDKYTWVDIGSSFVPSELICAVLYAQLEMIEWITKKRKRICRLYDRNLRPLEVSGQLRLPHIPEDHESNYHLYYLILPNREVRDALRAYLNSNDIGAASHYVPLHASPMGNTLGYRMGDLPITEDLSDRLLRLPNYPELSEQDQMSVIKNIFAFLESLKRKSMLKTVVMK
jgi:dTDP-4-amino-4,6-dideoxygalactose transaminase